MNVGSGFTPGSPSFEVPNLATLASSRKDQRAAALLALSLLVIAVVTALMRTVQLPALLGTVPAQATLVTAAYLVTANLMFSQFRSTGLLVLLTVGVGYVVTGLLQIPYGLAFPDVWVKGLLLGNVTTAAWSGVFWHLVFPILVGIHVAYDRTFQNAAAAPDRPRLLRIAVAASVLVACVITVVTFRQGLLPQIYANGRFQPALGTIGWTVTWVNLLVALAILWRTRCSTVLQVWLAVGLVGMGLDQMLFTVSPARYVVSWYASKGFAIATAAIVLSVLLRQLTVLYRQVAELAAIDQLTGLPNRRSLEGQLDWIIRYSERHRLALGAVMIDVDFFKTYNDMYGHSAGDVALKRIADALRTVLRSSDVIARYGGEEFLALLPDATREGAALTVERMRTAIEQLEIVHDGSSYGRVTATFGAAVGIVGKAGTPGLLLAADQALYAAKEDGRNRCIVVAFEDPSTPRFSVLSAR